MMLAILGFPANLFTVEETKVILNNDTFYATGGESGAEAEPGEIDAILNRVSKEYKNACQLPETCPS